MGLKPVLIIKSDEGIITVRARLRNNVTEHEIILNSVLTYYWDNDFHPVEKFLDLFESVIKRSINELTPHKDLFVKYNFKWDKKNFKLIIDLSDIVADNVGFKIEGSNLSLEGFKANEENSTDDDIVEDTIEKHIETPDIVLKKYIERNKKND